MSGSKLALAAAQPMLATLRATAADLETIEVLPLDTPANRGKAAALLRAVNDLVKRAEENRRQVVAPHKSVVSEIERAYRGPLEVLRGLGEQLRRRIAEAAEAQDRAEREARRVAYEAELRRQALVPETEAEASALVQQAARVSNAALATVPASPQKLEGVSVTFRWVVRSFDPALVPERFRRVVLDEDAIGHEIRIATERGADPSVPGVVFERVASTRVSR